MLSSSIRFHSLEQSFGADVGVAHLLTLFGMSETSLEDADIIVFNGGADIGTELYKEVPIMRRIPLRASQRDLEEVSIFEQYKDTNKLLVGICRGSQFLNVMNGGTLWQDVNNHTSSHPIRIIDTGQILQATSTHHQMMRPNYKTGLVIATANIATHKMAQTDEYQVDNAHHHYQDDHEDTEIVWYKNTGSLCIQGHPEYVPHSKFADYCVNLINHYYQKIKVHEDA